LAKLATLNTADAQIPVLLTQFTVPAAVAVPAAGVVPSLLIQFLPLVHSCPINTFLAAGAFPALLTQFLPL
jgi:uncharacterized integral membrane protein